MKLPSAQFARRKGLRYASPAIVCLAAVAPAAHGASPEPLHASGGMVVAESPVASWVGAAILQRGGNAVDAAIAVHFALAVTYPQAGNLGGGGFFLIRMADGTTDAIDFREIAPAAATRDMYFGADGLPNPALSTWALLATAVPGSVDGMGLAHERHATRPWADLLSPAISLARDGWIVDEFTANHLATYQGRLSPHPESRRTLLRGGRFWQPGDTLRQPELAATLERIARNGPREFYEGETARLIVAEMDRGGGIITAQDLRGYRSRIRVPISFDYRDHTILAMPPPSSGGVAVLQTLALLEPFPLSEWKPLGSRAIHLLTEALRHAFADRAEFLGDPDFSPVPVAGLLDHAYLDSLRLTIRLDRATSSFTAGPGLPAGASDFYRVTGDTPGSGLPATYPDSFSAPGEEHRETTHFSIVDREGNAVAVTTTLNTSYGSGLMATGAGFLLNNEMDDFATAPGRPNHYGLIQGEANAIRPFARPLSSMSPTIGLRGDTLAFVVGSPGGPHIISAVIQTIINLIDHEMDAQSAVDLPRVHHQWLPDTLFAEPGALVEDVRVALGAKGHAIVETAGLGSVQAIAARATPAGERILSGGSDSRRNGCAVGVQDGRWVARRAISIPNAAVRFD